MKLVILLFCLMGTVFGVLQEDPSVEEEVSAPVEDIVLEDDGHYELKFVDVDGTMVHEEGVLMTDEETGQDHVLVKKGMYAYKADDDQIVKLIYDGDDPENVHE